MKKLTCLLLICAVIGAVLGMGAGHSILPYISIFMRTVLDDADQNTARTTLGVGTGDSPAFTGITVTGNSVLGLNSAVFQPTADSTTFFQVLDADGGTHVLIVDSTNKRVGINRTSPSYNLDVNSSVAGDIGLSGTSASLYLTDTTLGNIFRLWSGDTGFHFDLDNAQSVANSEMDFRVDGTEILRLRNGMMGVTETNPETLIELTHATPYITLHNSTHEDTDGGGEVRIIGKREDGAGTETAAGQIEISHDGAGANDTNGKLIFSTNKDGTGLVEAVEIDQDQRVGIGIDPAARLHLKAGTAAAGTAPLKFESGTCLTTPEAGTLEYCDSALHFTEVVDRRIVSLGSDIITSATSVSDTVNETVLYTATVSAAELTAGKLFMVRGFGEISTNDAANVVTLRVKIGTVTVGTIASTAKTVSGEPWHIKAWMTIRTSGAGGTVSSHVDMIIEDTKFEDNISSQAIDTTGANNITITAQWNTADAGDVITIDQGYLEVIG